MEDITVRAVLGYAVEKEMEAQERYTEMAGMAERETTKELFLRLAGMEGEHKEKLQAMSTRDIGDYRLENVPDLFVSEKLGEREFSPGMGVLEAIALAIKAEESSMNLYLDAARGIPEGDDKKIFAVLAQEEKEHKLLLETEYEELKGGD